jgi:hypothetical protein
VHTGIDVCVYPDRCHAYRWVHVNVVPSIHLDIYVRMDVYLYLDTSTSERHRGARVGVRARARARLRGLHLR